MRFKSIEECIYCGKKECQLTDEHIIPYGLGGTDIIPNASCRSCQQVTSKFELTVLREELYQIRVKLDLPSRKSKFPSELPFLVQLGEEAKTFYLPTAEHPTFAVFLEYPLPGIFGGSNPDRGINIIGSQLWQIGGPSAKDTVKLDFCIYRTAT